MNAHEAPVVAIDGPSGSGKGTVARQLADALGWHLLDSGALYRLVAHAAVATGTGFEDAGKLAALAGRMQVQFGHDGQGEERILLDGKDVTATIRTETCGQNASRIAVMQPVRTALLALQRSFRKPPGLVADGRDMGSIVFPDAEVKIFLTASPDERAKRRHKQLKQKGINVSLAALSADIAERDRRDTHRAVAPLAASPGAVILDTTGVPVSGVVERVRKIVAQILENP